MTYRVTKKEVMENPYAICCGVCRVDTLLSEKAPDFRTCGIYGWNADVYQISYSTAIITGCRTFGNIDAPDTICKKYNDFAKEIHESYYQQLLRYSELVDYKDMLILAFVAEVTGESYMCKDDFKKLHKTITSKITRRKNQKNKVKSEKDKQITIVSAI